MKKNKRTCNDYVCEMCFNTLDECTCEEQPWYLVQIDRNIQEQIKVLNERGYTTSYCCESHDKFHEMYIAFKTDYGFDDMPEGFVFRKNNCAMYHSYNKKMTSEDFESDKQKHLDLLMQWCIGLPNRKV